MSVVYKGEHSILIGSYDTWKSWHLIPTSRPLVNPPKMNVRYVDVPGRNGSIDLTQAVTDNPSYTNRTGSWEFIVITNADKKDAWPSWTNAFTTIMNKCNLGRKNVILSDDKDYYYTGRVSVNSWKSDKDYSKIVLDYNFYPFKKERFSTTEPWLWDPFSFVNGVIPQDLKSVSIDGTKTVEIYGRAEPIIPVIKVNSGSNLVVSYNGNAYPLDSGNNTIPGLVMQVGKNTLTFSGTGNVTVTYRAGEF